MEMKARIDGVDLKLAEQVTRRLLSANMAMPYSAIPHDITTKCAQIATLNHAFEQFLSTAAAGESFDSCIPPSLDPGFKGTINGKRFGVPAKRSPRKRQQIGNMIEALGAVVAERHSQASGVLVDMCGGCGHVGLVFAALFPHWNVVIIDIKEFAIEVANKKIQEAKLTNAICLKQDITTYHERFDVVVALHACGAASDITLQKALKANASIVVSPCCVGGVVSKKARSVAELRETPQSNTQMEELMALCDLDNEQECNAVNWKIPRTEKLNNAVTHEEYEMLIRTADFGDDPSSSESWRFAAKTIIETDRCDWISRKRYTVHLIKMAPLSCTPKNDIIVAWPTSESHSGGLSWLSNENANSQIKSILSPTSGGMLNGFDATKVSEVQSTLQELLKPESCGEFLFPHSGAKTRKLIHAVAGSLGFHHASHGDKKARRVLVKRSSTWPLFFNECIGYSGQELHRALADAVAASNLAEIPTLLDTTEAETNGINAITLFNSVETKELMKKVEQTMPDILKRVQAVLRHQSPPDTVRIAVLSRHSVKNMPNIVAEIHWPAGDKVRQEFGFNSKPLWVKIGLNIISKSA